MPARHGGKILADQLIIHGCRRVFSVPGESFLPLLDGLHGSPIRNIVCRHEGGASMMAEASAKLTGMPGVAMVTRGPGATNASCGVHIARHDSTPMLLLIGQVPRDHRYRSSFQEMDFEKFFDPITKWAAEIPSAERIPEFIARAYHVARTGRPGPVALSLPEDMLHDVRDIADGTPRRVPVQAISRTDIDAIIELLSSVRRPLVVAGGSHWSQDAACNLGKFSGEFGLPVAAGFRRQDHIDNRHPNYCGDLSAGMNPALAEIVRRSDCLLLLGTRFGDIETRGYTLLDVVKADKQIVHVHPDPGAPGRIWDTAVPIAAPPALVIEALASQTRKKEPRDPAWLERCRSAYRQWIKPVDLPGNVRMSDVVTWLSENLDEQDIVTNGAGNYAAFLHRHFRFKQFGTHIGSTSGSMGYGLPASIAAKLEHPRCTVVCMAGDGCLQMTMNEFSTAVQFGAGIIVIVANNGVYGTIRMHQERHFPGRVSGTDLHNPDFSAIARAHGGHGETVTEIAEFPGAFGRAVSSGKPAIIDLKLDPAAISTSETLQDLQAAAAGADRLAERAAD